MFYGDVPMEITFDKICEKLGFNPLVNPPARKLSGHEDDSKESPYAILTFEKSDFLCEYMKKHNSETAWLLKRFSYTVVKALKE